MFVRTSELRNLLDNHIDQAHNNFLYWADLSDEKNLSFTAARNELYKLRDDYIGHRRFTRTKPIVAHIAVVITNLSSDETLPAELTSTVANALLRFESEMLRLTGLVRGVLT